LAKNRDILKSLQLKMLTPENRPPDSAYNINVTFSDTISLDRKVIDSRPPECLEIEYDVS
jgi:polypeptide N-acetylgalactosaminyltransferase